MDDQEIRAAVFAALQSVAPEISPQDVAPARALREEVDLDSMDFLNFLIRLSAAVGIRIPERDYGRLRSIDDIVAYVAAQRG